MHSRLPDKSRSSYPKHRFDRRFEPGSQGGTPRAFCVTFCTPQKVTIRFPLQGNFEVLQTSNQHTQVAVSHKLIKSLPLHGISSGRRGAAPYLYTQSVCAACFASILRRQSRSMAFPFGNISPTFKKVGQNKGHSPLPVHAKRVQMRPRFA